jgi:mono/diheme cytochrome c family protein
MKKALKWMGLIVGGLLAVLLLAVVGLSIAGGAQVNQRITIELEPITIPVDSAARQRGQHMVQVACSGCHGPDLTGGTDLLGIPAIGSIPTANLTGLAETHSDADLVRAIRHGVAPDGRRLMIMPAETFIHFSAEDLGAIVAYLKSLPAAGEPQPQPEITLVGRAMIAAGLFGQPFPAAYIDHEMGFHEMPETEVNLAHGEYLSRFCQACHGAELAGQQPPGDPSSPYAPGLTNSGRLQVYDEAGFLKAMRSGVAPDGRSLNPAYMPWESFGKFSDEELQALYMYLDSLPAATAGQ